MCSSSCLVRIYGISFEVLKTSSQVLQGMGCQAGKAMYALNFKHGKNFKLSATYYGTFEVLAKVGAVAYKLKLPPSSTIHRVSCFPPQEEDWRSTVVLKGLSNFVEDSVMVVPETVLQTRVVERGGQQILQGLIKWQNMPEDEATWEDQAFILSQFLEFQSYRGQEDSLGMGIVTYFRRKRGA